MCSASTEEQGTARRAYIALGSNLGDSISIIREAIQALAPLSTMPVVQSSLWRSTPVDCPPGSGDFINAVIAITPIADETPETLLSKLQALEKKFGRKPKVILNEARPLDLDLITFGAEVRNSATLTLPHPRAHLRQFVLEPLAEIAPELILRGQSKSVRQLLKALGKHDSVEKVNLT